MFTIDVVNISTGECVLVNQHADEDIEDAIERTFGEIKGKYRALYALRNVKYEDSFSFKHRFETRPDTQRALDGMSLNPMKGLYKVNAGSLIGRTALTHLRWLHELPQYEASVLLGAGDPRVTYHVPASVVREICAYLESCYDEEVKRQARSDGE